METTYEPRTDVLSTYKTLSRISSAHLVRFQQSTYCQSEDKTVSYYRNNKKIYSKKDVLTMYQIILDLRLEIKMQAAPHMCAQIAVQFLRWILYRKRDVSTAEQSLS